MSEQKEQDENRDIQKVAQAEEHGKIVAHHRLIADQLTAWESCPTEGLLFPGMLAELPPHQPNNPPTKAPDGLKRRAGSILRKIAPCDGDPNCCVRLVQRPKRRLKTKPTIASGATETLCQIETNAADGPPQLGGKVPVFTLNGLNERARQRNYNQ